MLQEIDEGRTVQLEASGQWEYLSADAVSEEWIDATPLHRI